MFKAKAHLDSLFQAAHHWLVAERYADREDQRAQISRRQMREVSISDQRMHADGSDKSAAPGQEEGLPETARRAAKPQATEHENTAGHDRPAKAGAIMSDQRDQSAIDGQQVACAES